MHIVGSVKGANVLSRFLSKCFLGALLVVGVGAQASPTTYTGVRDTGPGAPSGAPLVARSVFLGSVSNPGTENFSALSVGVPVNPIVTLGITFPPNGNSATISGDDSNGQANFSVRSGIRTGRYDTTGSGDQYLEVLNSSTFTFATGFSAFGFYATDVGDLPASLTAVLTRLGGGTDTTITVLPSGIFQDGALLFWGFVDPNVAYTSIRLTSSNPEDLFALDDIIVGNACDTCVLPTPVNNVAEPTTLALFGVGLLGIAAARRRKAA